MNCTSIEQQLERDGVLLQYSVGVSMRPMLTERTEQIVIKKLDRQPKTNDVLLFKRASGQYVLHRMVGKKGDIFIIRGDNCFSSERVPADCVLGRLTGFYRQNRFVGKDRYVDCDRSKAYRAYVVIIRAVYPVRYLLNKAKRGIKKILKLFKTVKK